MKESIMTGASVLRRPRNENPQNLKEGVYFYEPHRGANVLRSYKYAYEHACEERDRQSRYLESQRDLNVWLEIRNEDLLREIKALRGQPVLEVACANDHVPVPVTVFEWLVDAVEDGVHSDTDREYWAHARAIRDELEEGR